MIDVSLRSYTPIRAYPISYPIIISNSPQCIKNFPLRVPTYLHNIINISDSCLNCLLNISILRYELLNWLGWRGNFWCKFGVVGTFSLFASLLSPSILFMDLICQRIWINLKCFTLSRCGVQNQSICHLFSLICHPCSSFPVYSKFHSTQLIAFILDSIHHHR